MTPTSSRLTQWLANNNNADVLSQSYGEAETCMANHLLMQQHEIFDKLNGGGDDDLCLGGGRRRRPAEL